MSTEAAGPKIGRRRKSMVDDTPDDFVLPEGDAARGAKLFKKHCKQCHSIEPDSQGAGLADAGPTLWNIYNRTSGQINHHSVNQSLQHTGLVWGDVNLMRYMYDPTEFVERNVKMNFVGMRNFQDRVDIIHYLKTLTDAGRDVYPPPLESSQACSLATTAVPETPLKGY